MIDLVQICLNVLVTLGILGTILAISYKKIVPYFMKKTLAGYMSGFSRNQKAVKKEVVKLLMDKSLIGPILDGLGLPNVKRYMLNHPDATMTVVDMIAPYIQQFLPYLPIGENASIPDLTPINVTQSTQGISERVKALMDKMNHGET